jgi:glycine/D-amino acid oxidase-like deaminating enzyme
MKRVVIAGGGIMGASIAWHLARRGAVVTLLEKTRPGAGATGDSFAWINATFSKQPRHYYELNRQGIDAWRLLEIHMGHPLKIQWGGSVEWCAPGSDAEELRKAVERHRQWGYSTRFINREEFGQILPGVRPGHMATAAFSDEEGTLDPVAAVNALLTEACGFGATVVYPSEVTGIGMLDGRIQSIATTHGSIEADVLVAACGIATPKVAAMAGVKVPLKESMGVLVQTAPQPRLLNRVILAPGSHIKQDASGRVVAGNNFAGGEGQDASLERGEHLLKQASRYVSQLQRRPERVSLGRRVMPVDEFPIVGFAAQCPNLYIVATHSGITLAPLIGEFAAQEILNGVRIEMLSPYRLERFQAHCCSLNETGS